MTEQLITCKKCSAPTCSEVATPDITYYACFSCGFLSSTLLKGEIAKQYTENLPELYKDLEFIDDNGLHWYPQSVIMDDKAMVFAEGTSIDDWKWAAVKAKDGKPDMTTKVEFEQNEFCQSLEYIGYFH